MVGRIVVSCLFAAASRLSSACGEFSPRQILCLRSLVALIERKLVLRRRRTLVRDIVLLERLPLVEVREHDGSILDFERR
jgi:hypothetical protein